MTTSIIIVLIAIVNAFVQITNASAENAYALRPLKEVQNNANIGTSSNDNKVFIEGRRLNIYPNQPDNHGRDSGVQTASPVVGNTQYRYNSGNFDDNKARTLTNRMGGGTYNTQNSGQNGNNAMSSYEADRNSRPTATNYNVNLNNPARTTVTSNGMGWVGTNGVDTRNAFSINNNRQEPQRTQSRFFQNGENSGGSVHRQQILREILEKAQIGTGNNNNNQIYVNGERIDIYPNRAAKTTVTSNGMGWVGTNGVDTRNAFSINNNRQEPQRTESRFYQNGENSGGSIDRQHVLKEILDKADIGTGNNNDNQIYVDGVRINVNPNPADNYYGRDAGVRTGNPLIGNTQYSYNSRNGEENIARTLTNRMGGGTYNTQYSGQNGNNAKSNMKAS
ncbi:unnamed protein product [Danaus chrysippus]|uniref:(African queen) hypothetical protein n=1 Tax=Danaus chrysippus TaxID=151541 RepID=A0A8J2QJL6_9NEOP|nr:unnamed protein product [Danaus chrysippus]